MSKKKRTSILRKRHLWCKPGVAAAIFAVLYSVTRKALLCVPSLILGGVAVLIFLTEQSLRWRKKKKYLRSGIDVVDKMTGEQFEDFSSCLFERLGYTVNFTPLTNDYGADLILKQGGKKTVIQNKRYASTVGIAAVQQITAAKNFYKADSGIVVTNNYFSKNAIELAGVNSIELWDRDRLIQLMSNTDKSKCPCCGNNLVIRQGKHGDFYGCCNYPYCTYTRNI